ncbi:MAG TPA: glycosyltransferase family 4 protein [Ferruginibacter sp.]|nr:glycosyltransferase family 4 protein [Ferruginibacter sp.]
MKKLIFLNSHPIQYFAPLYQQITQGTNIPLEVWYCSDESIKGKLDKGFGTAVKWDIPLLQGYAYQFLPNDARNPSIHGGLWGLKNKAVKDLLRKTEPSVIVVHGWAYYTHVRTLLTARRYGHRVCLRAETPWNQELLKNKAITWIKHWYLRFLFSRVSRFLYIGTQNKLFYRQLGVKETQLLFTPYAVDNQRFQETDRTITITDARKKLGLPLDKTIVLYSGKYIAKKRPLDLLKAIQPLPANVLVVLVGDGELRPELEKYIQEHQLQERVILTGFVNQSAIPLYYKAADLFVMCSGLGETWGLSVNEAMNFSLPVVVSETCGSSYDLVQPGINGWTFPTGDIAELTKTFQQFLSLSIEERKKMGAASRKRIDEYGYDQIIEGLQQLINE